jgi:hypothetical protein
MIAMILASATHLALAQADTVPENSTTTAALSLPDSPGFLATRESSSSTPEISDASDPQGESLTTGPTPLHRRLISHRDITIEPNQTVSPLSAHAKMVMGLEQSFTLFSVAGWTASAGYSQLVNGTPNYGTDSGAFGARLGATAIRNTSQNIFSNAVFAPMFHQDFRYYKMGSGHNFVKRAAYAATRALITRSDDGQARPNYSLLSGNLAGAALTNAYYPRMNQGFTETAKTFGTSVGGSAVGFVVSEFLYDALDFAHLQKLE